MQTYLICCGILVALLGYFGVVALVVWVGAAVFKAVLLHVGIYRDFLDFMWRRARDRLKENATDV